jgi:hypothetical protein
MTLSVIGSCGFEWANVTRMVALEERRRGVRQVLALHFPGGTEKNHKNLSKDNRCTDRELNRAPPKCESIALPPDQTIRLMVFRLWACYQSRDSSVSIVTDHGLVDRSSISARARDFYSTESRPTLGPTQPPIR